MTVPVGHLELGQLLLRSMYQDQPNFADLQQVLWLPLLVLADAYSVPKVAAALCQKFVASWNPQTELEWETVTDFYSLPDSVLDNNQYSGIRRFVARKVQHELGDLEVVWSSEQKQQMLLQLPFKALERLLASDRTAVASENTVAYTVMQWIHKQPPSQNRQQQLRQLLGLVRMSHCSRLFVTTSLSNNADVCSCLSPYELQIAGLCCGMSGNLLKFRANSSSVKAVLDKYPSWLQYAGSTGRPTSGVSRLEFAWGVPLDSIKKLFEECIDAKADTGILQGPTATWQGRTLALGLQLCPELQQTDQSATEPGSCFSRLNYMAHVALHGSTSCDEMAEIHYRLTINTHPPPLMTRSATPTRRARVVMTKGVELPPQQGYLTGHSADSAAQYMVCLQNVESTWAAVESELRKVGALFNFQNDERMQIRLCVLAID